MQTKEVTPKLCNVCQVAMTTKTLETVSLRGVAVSFPCCIPCSNRVAASLHNEREELSEMPDIKRILEGDEAQRIRNQQNNYAEGYSFTPSAPMRNQIQQTAEKLVAFDADVIARALEILRG